MTMITIEDLARIYHESTRHMVTNKIGMITQPTKPFIEWNDLTDEMREGRRDIAREMLKRCKIYPLDEVVYTTSRIEQMETNFLIAWQTCLQQHLLLAEHFGKPADTVKGSTSGSHISIPPPQPIESRSDNGLLTPNMMVENRIEMKFDPFTPNTPDQKSCRTCDTWHPELTSNIHHGKCGEKFTESFFCCNNWRGKSPVAPVAEKPSNCKRE